MPTRSPYAAQRTETKMAATAARRRKDTPAPQPRGETARRAGARAPSDRRANILEVATRRFAEHGFEATTVRQIGDDVNILSGSLYHHFATKEEMLHEIVREAVQQMRNNALRIARAPVDAERRLVALILLGAIAAPCFIAFLLFLVFVIVRTGDARNDRHRRGDQGVPSARTQLA